MARSKDMDEFEYHYQQAQLHLKGRRPRNIAAENTLDNFAQEKGTYASFLLKQIKGSINRVGSASSEQNHSSVSCFLNDGVKGENKYCADPHILIQDLIARLEIRISKYDKILANNTNQLDIINHKLKEDDRYVLHITTHMLIEASSLKLSFTAYKMFNKEMPYIHVKRKTITNIM